MAEFGHLGSQIGFQVDADLAQVRVNAGVGRRCGETGMHLAAEAPQAQVAGQGFARVGPVGALIHGGLGLQVVLHLVVLGEEGIDCAARAAGIGRDAQRCGLTFGVPGQVQADAGQHIRQAAVGAAFDRNIIDRKLAVLAQRLRDEIRVGLVDQADVSQDASGVDIGSADHPVLAGLDRLQRQAAVNDRCDDFVAVGQLQIVDLVGDIRQAHIGGNSQLDALGRIRHPGCAVQAIASLEQGVVVGKVDFQPAPGVEFLAFCELLPAGPKAALARPLADADGCTFGVDQSKLPLRAAAVIAGFDEVIAAAQFLLPIDQIGGDGKSGDRVDRIAAGCNQRPGGCAA